MTLRALYFGLQIISFILHLILLINVIVFSFEVLCCFIQEVFILKVALKV